ncbi:hypothetical protein [Rhizobium redzepovicii]|uniref:hypothetical protein n=1 Tax=Rhizobium redzepovicii TaxID=2867518 RepID=UPI00161C221C|nr:hypothetical protein [Rhizobium redzepovicii]MBY4590371.1 hypothetical protein [Rhizobium redzepovicii]
MIVSSGSRRLCRETSVAAANSAEPHVRLAACAKLAHDAGVKNRQRHGFNKARME